LGIFNRNFNKPGPGVNKDEPRKKGVARFFELLMRDFADLVKLNVMFCIVLIPSVAAFVFGSALLSPIFGFLGPIFVFVLALVFAFPVGGALTAYYYYITKMMRDDPSYVWFEFKRKFLENYKQAAPIGILCAGFSYAQVMLWYNLIITVQQGGMVDDFLWYLLVFLSFIIFMMIVPYIFMHYAYVSLGTFQILKNSVMMAFGYLPRSIMASLLGGSLGIAFALFYPYSALAVPLILLFGVSIAILLSLMWVWPVFDKCFKIEETLIQREEEEGVDVSD